MSTNDTNKKNKTIITHSGTFHADDVVAVATFVLAHRGEEWQIVRSREKEVVEVADAVIDTGSVYDQKTMRFDHHQAGGAGMHENSIPYAAFGLVWKEYGTLVCGGDFFITKQIEDSLVSALDAHDNGVKIYEELYSISPFELSRYVSAFNPTWLEEERWGEKSEEKKLEIFLKLVDWAKELILREIKRHKDKNIAYTQVKEIYEKSFDKQIIILEKYLPWQDALLEYPEPLFVLYPADVGMYGNWVIRTVPKEKGSFESRKLLPKSWVGKKDEELANDTGISDAIYCHNNGFLATAKSREGAIKLAELALKEK